LESLRKKIQALEHRWFPEVLVSLLHKKRIPQQNEN
jgi:folate-dependent phosphoribosylglycinamide formyltransferase PurN